MEEVSFTDLLLPIGLGLAMIATVGVLVYGIVQLAKSKPQTGEAEIARARKSNQLMQYRIVLQAAALLIFLLILWLKK
jgi:hypothetical protein